MTLFFNAVMSVEAAAFVVGIASECPRALIMRYWAGLVFNKAGRSALAAAEFSAAAKAGLIGAAERLERCRRQA